METIGNMDGIASHLPGGGQMGELVRRLDWARTPLGPIEHWPQSLLTSVGTCLDCAFPILIWWGPDLVKIYNDEYRPILGAKHPQALGAPGREVWPEIWDVIGPMLAQVVESGQATRSRDLLLLMNRYGFEEEAYFSFSYSPIRDETGGVGGVFTPVIETTGKVVGERRLLLLRELAARSGGETVEAVARNVMAVLAEAEKDAPFAILYRFEASGRAVSMAMSGLAPGSKFAPEAIGLDGPETDLAWPLARVLGSGKRIVIHGALEGDPDAPRGAWETPPTDVLLLPVFAGGQESPFAALVAGANPKRPLDDEQFGFFDLIANQIGNSLADAMAMEEERRRAAALAELDRAKTVFFSNVSHEFRTPLTLLLGPLERMLSVKQPDPGTRGLAEVAYRNASRLLRLVNALLDFSRIEAGRLDATFAPVDIAAVTADLAAPFRSLVEGGGLRFVVEPRDVGDAVYLDADLWEKIVLNLLSNAFKYTLAGEVRVGIGRSADGRSAELVVSDTGVGIPASELPRLFERFHRVEGVEGRSFEGTGIGLALVQELVKLHGGSVRVESEPGRGTTFTVALPLGKAHLPAERIREGAAQRLAGVVAAFVDQPRRWETGSGRRDGAGSGASAAPDGDTVLVVDDNADMRDYLRDLLSEAGLGCRTAEDGVAGLEAARAARPGTIVSDVMMPRLDGVGLLRELRADPALRDVPVILLSARAGEEDRVSGVEAGADDYLLKPFSARELVTRVSTHLRLGKLRREALDAVLGSERRLRMAQEVGRVAAWEWSSGAATMDANGAMARLWGFAEPASLDGFLAAVHADDRERLRDALARCASDGAPVVEEYRVSVPAAPDRRWFATRAERIAEGAPPRVIGVHSDVTERREAEIRLRELNALLEAAVVASTADRDRLWNLSADIMLVARFDATIVAVNPAWTRVFGWRADELIGKSYFDFMHPDDRAQSDGETRRLSSGTVTRHFENRYRTTAGEWRWIDWTATPDAKFIHAVGRDVTEEKERVAKLEAAENQLRQAQKMEAVGQLTGGIAHDFNNVLAALMGSLELIKKKPDDRDRIAKLSEAALQAAERGTKLTAQLLTFSRAQEMALGPVAVADLVRGMDEMLTRALGPLVELRFVADDGGASALTDATQLEMAVLNLAINARDAMPEGGRLLVRTSIERVDDDVELPPAEYVVLSVTDEGSGMPDEVASRAFDPFFTTKPLGKGTGLGLSQVYGMAKRSGGTVRIRTARGQGTTVSVFLPLSRASVALAEEEDQAAVSPTRCGTVLVVDDDPDVRRSLVRSLESLGHSVVEAATGAEALGAIEASTPDWLVVDFAMPGMNGADLAKALRERVPGLPTVFVTGYADTAAIAAWGADACVLKKPFRIGELEDALSRVADGAGRPRL